MVAAFSLNGAERGAPPRIAAMAMPFEARLAVRYLTARRGGAYVAFISLIAATGVAVGGAALVIALALMNGFQGAIAERLRGANADLSLISGGEGIAPPERARIEEFLRADPAVKAVAPVAGGAGLIASDFSREARLIKLVGVEPEKQTEVVDLGRFVREGDLQQLHPDGIFLGQELALTLGVAVGDPVRVTVPNLAISPFGAVPRSRRYVVAGIIGSGYFQYDSENGYLRYDEAASLLGLDGRATALLIRCRAPELTGALKARLAPRLRDSSLSVLDLEEVNRDFFKAMRTEKLALAIGISLILAVAVLNITSMLVLLVVEKTRAIGILTALGATPPQIRRAFLAMGLVIGGIGTLAGAGGGLLLSLLAGRYRWFKLSLAIYPIDHVPFAPRPLDALAVAALTLAIALVATLHPASRAAKLDPVAALRHD